jgi:hypothetical protein
MDNLIKRPFKEYSFSEWDNLLYFFDGTINYTSWFINYIEILNSSFVIENLTFALFKDNKIIAIVPLYVEKIDGKNQISMGQEPIYAPIFNVNLSHDSLSQYYKYIVTEIERFALQYKCTLARFHYSPLLYKKDNNNYFIEFEYKEIILYPEWYIFKSNFSYIINLNMKRELLLKQIRKGHRANISSTKKFTNLLILDKDSYNQELFNRYLALYYQVKGVGARSIEAFKLDSVAIKSGFEAIMLCEYKGKLIGAIAIHLFNKKAKYNSSAQLYHVDKGIYPNHFLLFSAINYLKEKKVVLFEIGEQVSPSEMYQLSKKEKNLSHFKAGWGGDLKPYMKAQKEFYYD